MFLSRGWTNKLNSCEYDHTLYYFYDNSIERYKRTQSKLKQVPIVSAVSLSRLCYITGSCHVVIMLIYIKNHKIGKRWRIKPERNHIKNHVTDKTFREREGGVPIKVSYLELRYRKNRSWKRCVLEYRHRGVTKKLVSSTISESWLIWKSSSKWHVTNLDQFLLWFELVDNHILSVAYSGNTNVKTAICLQVRIVGKCLDEALVDDAIHVKARVKGS